MELKEEKPIIGYTTGVYDMFHIGHLNILKSARAICDFLIVGVSTDELVMKEKDKRPVIPFEERAEIISSVRYVDYVVPQLDKNKFDAWKKYRFDIMFVGDDWKGTEAWNRYEDEFREVGVKIIYLPHTDGISSTNLTNYIKRTLSEEDN